MNKNTLLILILLLPTPIDIRVYYAIGKSSQTEVSYFTSINSYDNWFISNKTTVALLVKDPFNLDLLLGGEHKETAFYENLSYDKNSLEELQT